MPDEVDGRRFRDAWIAGVLKHYPGQAKPSYTAPWEDMPPWERDSAAGVYQVVAALLAAVSGAAERMTRDQKGRFVALCWLAHIHKHFPEPKPSYIADWDDLPQWQKETDADIFDQISDEVRQAT